jgi:hypothetical protein|tara:strand:- start:152 stop:406 length:255 start_codon:yes stop_codon:yes gene_type:complete
MSDMISKTEQFKEAIKSIVTRAPGSMKRFVIHNILWDRGLSGYPPADGGTFQNACDELIAEGFMTATRTARGTTYELAQARAVA